MPNMVDESKSVFLGKLASKEVTGQLIKDLNRRQQWYDLVVALQLASETAGGPLEGWVFHGTDEVAAPGIDNTGLVRAVAYIPMANNEWIETEGVHFGTANVAAFFAEDRIESREDPDLELVIYGAPLAELKKCGPLAVDGQMLDVPLYSRVKTPEADVFHVWRQSSQDWQACLRIFETVVVLADIPRKLLTAFKSVDDVHNVCEYGAMTPATTPRHHARPRI